MLSSSLEDSAAVLKLFGTNIELRSPVEANALLHADTVAQFQYSFSSGIHSFRGLETLSDFAWSIHKREDKSNAPIGVVFLRDYDEHNRYGVVDLALFSEEKRRQGYGTETCAIFLFYVFECLNIWKVSAHVAEYNLPSIVGCRSFGFIEEGRISERLNRFGRRWSVIIFGLTRDQFYTLERHKDLVYALRAQAGWAQEVTESPEE
jgi:RimJ/RimL family protein N-acetyltransferase